MCTDCLHVHKAIYKSSAAAHLHFPVMIDVEEALPELDNLQGHK